ncbi:hypothetical protein LOTGIDRAFT_106852, partial [Lottia gigantea]
GPGPGGYILPTGVGKTGHDPTKRIAPAYSFGSRYKSFSDNSPGPIYQVDSGVTNKGRDAMPKYSIGSRWTPKKNVFVTPGPITYNFISSKKSPKYSFGSRIVSQDNTPGPGPNYMPSDSIGSNVKTRGALMLGRTEKFGYAHDWSKTPGPITSSDGVNITFRRPPAFSFQGRSRVYQSKDVTPAPGAYDVKSYGDNVHSSPRFTMGARQPFSFTRPVYSLADVSD